MNYGNEERFAFNHKAFNIVFKLNQSVERCNLMRDYKTRYRTIDYLESGRLFKSLDKNDKEKKVFINKSCEKCIAFIRKRIKYLYPSLRVFSNIKCNSCIYKIVKINA